MSEWIVYESETECVAGFVSTYYTLVQTAAPDMAVLFRGVTCKQLSGETT